MPGPALPEAEIRSRARRSINEGRLPVMLVRNLAGGYGSGEPCWVCGEKITSSQVEYEVPAERERLMRFHLICYAEWQLECAQRTRERASSAG